MIVIFNDPVPCPDPALRAVRLAVEMREAVASLARSWTARGHEIGFGVGIAQGYATLGQIGFEGRSDYTAMGTVTNLAARLCAEAKDGQILVTRRIAAAIDRVAELEPLGDLAIKGPQPPGRGFERAQPRPDRRRRAVIGAGDERHRGGWHELG